MTSRSSFLSMSLLICLVFGLGLLSTAETAESDTRVVRQEEQPEEAPASQPGGGLGPFTLENKHLYKQKLVALKKLYKKSKKAAKKAASGSVAAAEENAASALADVVEGTSEPVTEAP